MEAICEREMSRGKEQAQACIEAILVKRSDAASAHFTREGRRPILKHALEPSGSRHTLRGIAFGLAI